jgi:hypothetical protein
MAIVNRIHNESFVTLDGSAETTTRFPVVVSS